MPADPPQRGTCGRCGKTHAKDSCPSMGKTCLKCKKANHFANMCKTRAQKVHEVSDNPYQTWSQPCNSPVAKSPNSSPGQAGKRVGENGEFGSYCKSHGTHRLVNSIATPEKQRTVLLRVCLVPRDLNQAVKREHYFLPALKELTFMLSNAKYFSVLECHFRLLANKARRGKLLINHFQHTVWALSFHPNAIRHTHSTRGVPEDHGHGIWRH